MARDIPRDRRYLIMIKGDFNHYIKTSDNRYSVIVFFLKIHEEGKGELEY